ncbi:MAG: hypothetical protein FWG13_03360 [Leptospirales bacterium]|nr:hypothetical protein [Leptospirales bacterium]
MLSNNLSGNVIDFENVIAQNDPKDAAAVIMESSDEEEELDPNKKDLLDRFLDFVYFKIQTGYWEDFNDAYPTKRMNDEVLEKKIIEILNEHLYPNIVLKILKFMTRNVYEPDTNLFIANLIHSKDIIHSIYNTYVLFKKDVYDGNKETRCLNVMKIQQFPIQTSNDLSSPLEAAARLKYVLEFLTLKNNLDDIFTKEDLLLSVNPA